MVKITNYKEGKIYIITSKLDRTMKYIGSTCNSLSKRLTGHRADSKKDKNKGMKIYQYFNENSWANAEISLLETCPCKSKMELLMKEREWKDKINPSLNIINPYTTKEENMQHDREFYKQYYKENAEEIKQRQKQIYKQHAEEIRNMQKKYREQHKTKTECPNCKKTLLTINLEKHMETKTCQEQYFRTKYAFDDCSNEPYNLNYIE